MSSNINQTNILKYIETISNNYNILYPKKYLINIIIEKELKSLLIILERIIFDHNGIIYDEYVKDYIISNYYTNEYIKMNQCISEPLRNIYEDECYWDIDFCPTTSPRIIVPTYINIHFKEKEAYILFKNNLNNYFGNRVIFDKENIYSYEGNYLNMLEKQEINISEYIFKSYSFQGIILNFKIYVTYPAICNFTLEPPFNQLDITYNSLLLTKDGIRISKNTGTDIDNYSVVNKHIICTKIMKDIINFKTDICTIQLKSYNEKEFIKKILDLIKKINYTPEWTISNLPFKILPISNDDNNKICNICLKSLIINDDTKKVILNEHFEAHNKCFIDYLDKSHMIDNSDLYMKYKLSFKNIQLPDYLDNNV